MTWGFLLVFNFMWGFFLLLLYSNDLHVSREVPSNLFYLELSNQGIYFFFTCTSISLQKDFLGNFTDCGGKEYKPKNSEMAKEQIDGTDTGLQKITTTPPRIKP